MAFKEILRRRAKKQVTPQLLWTLSPYQILGTPIITEKAFGQMEKINVYTFLVHDTATKTDVVAALQYIYKVTPLSIRVVNSWIKIRQRRGVVRKAYKKVYVTLKTGDSIELSA